MSIERFAEKWGSAFYPPEVMCGDDLVEVERELRISLPYDYWDAMTTVGRPQPTIALLDAIVERELDIASVGDFYSYREIVEETNTWREIGMPDHLVAIAGDESGNKFCFAFDEIDQPRVSHQSVWFFDHDFGTVREIAPSFKAWIETLCDIEPWSEEQS